MTDNITLPRATVQQALEALIDAANVLSAPMFAEAVDALKAALEQQQAEPVPEPFDDLATELFVVAQRSPADDGFSDTIDRIESWLREHFSTPPQQQAEPVGWPMEEQPDGTMTPVDPAEMAPPQRQWVGLTDEDYLNALDLHPYEGTDREFWNVLETKLKEKNT